MAQVDAETTHRFEIDPEGKYIILVPDYYGDGNPSWDSDMERAKKAIREWWKDKDGNPFLVMPDSWKLMRVGEPGEIDGWHEKSADNKGARERSDE